MIALTHSFHKKLSCSLNAHIVVVTLQIYIIIYILMGVTNLANISDMNSVVFCPSKITHYMVVNGALC